MQFHVIRKYLKKGEKPGNMSSICETFSSWQLSLRDMFASRNFIRRKRAIKLHTQFFIWNTTNALTICSPTSLTRIRTFCQIFIEHYFREKYNHQLNGKKVSIRSRTFYLSAYSFSTDCTRDPICTTC